jgi:Kelch motif protein
MSNGTFQRGTWNQLPTNCTRDYTLTYLRCSEYGTIAVTECISWVQNVVQTCVQWAWSTANQCISWATQTSNQCCTWWPCSWGCKLVMLIVSVVCVAFAVVVTAVCVAFAFVVSFVCVLFAIIVYVVCMLWSVIEIIFCLSSANGGTSFLLTDGSVMVQECKDLFGASIGATWPTSRWWKLSPDQSGSYANGRWSRLADSTVARKYFGSSVLADGRVVVCGGEYSDASGTLQQDENNTCEIYDPVANTWTRIDSPVNPGSPGTTWAQVGDVASTVLPDGTFLIASNGNGNLAKLDPSTLKWTAMNPRPGVSSSSEDSWVLMPDGTIAEPSCMSPPTTWVYDITIDKWTRGNALPVGVVDAGSEIGGALLRYDGTAFFLGGNQHTAIFTPGAKPSWSNGPDLPTQNGQNLGVVDGPAALLVNGNILFAAGPIDAKGSYLGPCYYFELAGSTFNRTNDPPNNGGPTYMTRLLLLPNGDVFLCREDSSSFYAYHSDAAQPQDSFRPVIRACPPNLQSGTTIQISGLQFNGLSQAVAYGDDSQTPTNYPLVKIVNKQSQHVRYCRTLNHTKVDASGKTIPSMGVATGNTLITTNVQISGDIEAGPSSLFVVANGIPSQPFDVTIVPNLT